MKYAGRAENLWLAGHIKEIKLYIDSVNNHRRGKQKQEVSA